MDKSRLIELLLAELAALSDDPVTRVEASVLEAERERLQGMTLVQLAGLWELSPELRSAQAALRGRLK